MRKARTLCLNMIVKNEMANLERCLGSVAPYIACWVIGDTGSSDGTQEFIRSFFGSRDIPGELHSFPFVNFAQARNEALRLARASALRFDYLLLTDADMELTVQSPTFAEDLTSAAYKVLQRSGVSYWNIRLLRRDAPCGYKGVTHEYLDVRSGKTRNLEGLSFIDYGTGSNRVDKYERDARLLTSAIATERDAGMIARYTFYLANTLRDSGQKEAALKAYLDRAHLAQWDQEVFLSLLNAAKLQEALGSSNDEVLSAYIRAAAACPTRAEALHGAARFCREKGVYERGYEFAAKGLAVAYPNEALFVEDWIYQYGLLDELAICAYWTERYAACVSACDRLLNERKLPTSHRDRVLKNRNFAVGEQQRIIAASSADSGHYLKLLRIAREKEEARGPRDEVICAYMEAAAACPAHAEALHAAARYCRHKGLYERGYEFATKGLAIAYPNDGLPVEDWIYQYGLLDELAVCAYWTERYAECMSVCDRLLSEGKLPNDMRDRVSKNRDFAIGKQQEITAASSPDLGDYIRLLRAAREKERLGDFSNEIIAAYVEAAAACSRRAEALHGAAQFCRKNGLYEEGYEFAKKGSAIAHPNDGEFVENWIYQYGLLDELAVCAYWTDRYAECMSVCDRLLSEGELPNDMRDRIKKNRQFAIDKLGGAADPKDVLQPWAGQLLEKARGAADDRLNYGGELVPASVPGRPLPGFTKEGALPYAVSRAFDCCPDISVDDLRTRIGYASYVNVERRYMYYEVAKAGCTAVKWLLHSLEQLPPIAHFVGSQREARRDMFIHERTNIKIPSLLDLDNATQEFVLTSPEFMRFTVVRNPYTRIESAWKDKVRLCAPTYERLYLQIRGTLPAGNDPSSLISFREFVKALWREDLANCDSHWRLQVAQTLRGALNFSHIGRLEDFSKTIHTLYGHLGITDIQRPATLNRTVGQSYYDEEIATEIYELYRQDFETFDYERNSWVKRSNDDRLLIIPEEVFVEEVLERNIVISHLYEQRDALKRRVEALEEELRTSEQFRKIENESARQSVSSRSETLVPLLQYAWENGKLTQPNEATIALYVEAAVSWAAAPKALQEAAQFCREKGMYDASVLFCEAGFTLAISKQMTTPPADDDNTLPRLQEEFSIAANYSRDLRIKDRGFAACNWLALSRDVTESSRELARWNLFFYIKSASAILPSFTSRPLRFTPPEGYRAMSPSVARMGEQLVVAQWCVNDILTDDSKDQTSHGGFTHTRYYLLRLDQDLDVRSAVEISPRSDMPDASGRHLQDTHLLAWRGELWCTASGPDPVGQGQREKVLARIDASGPAACAMTDWRALPFNGTREVEEQWVPLIDGDELRFIYLGDPSRVLDDEARTIVEIRPLIVAQEFHGVTQAIGFDGGWLALAHEVSERNGHRYCQHRFLWFDSANRLGRVSRPFYFRKNGIEFAAGLAWHPDQTRLLISYGVDDRDPWIATVDAAEVREILEDAERLPSGLSGGGRITEERWAARPNPVALSDRSGGPKLGDKVLRPPMTDCDVIVMANDTDKKGGHSAALRREVIEVVRNGGLGDVLMCTPALRALKRAKPDCLVRFYTYWHEVVAGLPYIDEVHPTSAAPSAAIHLSYEEFIPPYAHIASVFGHSLGIDVTDVRPDCVIRPDLVGQFQEAWKTFPRPHITVNRRASRWTPNKDWPNEHWEELITRLTRTFTVIEIGDSDEVRDSVFSRNYVDLVGRTSFAQFVSAIAAADIHVGPISAPVHIAAAAHRPSVVICGGYEHPRCTLYSGNVALYTPVACAPCWLQDPCPYGRKCLDVISPAAVEEAIRSFRSGLAATTPRDVGEVHR
jgi:ADP-heptose:LPS heptosyltransferase/glycosyltransferase involved in cell wall biosynthesis